MISFSLAYLAVAIPWKGSVNVVLNTKSFPFVTSRFVAEALIIGTFAFWARSAIANEAEDITSPITRFTLS